MSIPNLPVDFKDDILASSNTKRKYRQTTNGDSTVSFEDVTNYSQKGSEFGAKEVNQTNKAINNIYDERVLDVDALELITEPGFFVDAQAVKELNGKSLKLATFRETYTINANAIRKIQLSKSDFEVADDTTFLAVWCECDTPNPSVYTSSVTPNLRLYVANSTQSGANIPVNVFALYK